MKQKSIFCKRLLIMVLSLAMVLTSVNVPTMTVKAAQTDIDESIQAPFGEGISYNETNKTIDVVWGYNPQTMSALKACVSIKGVNTETVYEKVYDDLGPAAAQSFTYGEDGDWEAGKIYRVDLQLKNPETEKYSAAVTKDVTIPGGEEGDGGDGSEEGGGDNSGGGDTEVKAPGTPFGLTAAYCTDLGDNYGKIWMCWGGSDAAGGTATSWEIYIDNELILTTPNVAAYWLENKYAAGTHVIKLIAVNDAGKSAAATYELVLTEDQAGGTVGGETTTIPSAPSGVSAGYCETEGDNYGRISVVWGSDFGTGGAPTTWEVYIDDKLVGAESAVATYYYPNNYTAGPHTVKVVALNAAGSSEAAQVTFELTEAQAGSSTEGDGSDNSGNDDSTKNTVLVDASADLTGIVINESGGTPVNGWGGWTNEGISAVGGINSTVTFTYPAGMCGSDWALQLYNSDDAKFNLTQGEYYTLTFTAESSIPRYMEVCMDNGGRSNDLIYKLPGGQATEITYVFAAAATGTHRIQFLLGTNSSDASPFWTQEGGHTLKLSNISLVKTGSAENAGANSAVAADKSALSEALAECKKLEKEDYSQDSWNTLEAAMKTAEAVANDASASKKAADDALVDLQIAKASLMDASYDVFEYPITAAEYIDFEELTSDQLETYFSQNDGGWGGDAGASITYTGTKAVASATNFGWGPWAVQWKLKGLTSNVTNNVFAFDVVSTNDKKFLVKNETTGATETIELKAGVTTHIARRVTGNTLSATFDLSLDAVGGTITFSNMQFGEEITCYNFEKQEEAGNVTLYVGTDWAGTVATGKAGGTRYTIDASTFGWKGDNEWGLQLVLNNFLNVATDRTYDIHAKLTSSVDKTVTVKLADPNDGKIYYALQQVELKAGIAKEILIQTDLAETELENATLYFACGDQTNASGVITVENLYVIPKKDPDKEAPVLGTSQKNDKENGFRIGEKVVLTYGLEAAAWGEKIAALKVDNKTLAKDEFTVDKNARIITLSADLFTKYDVYKITVEAEGYKKANITVPVYDPDIVNEDWETRWADEFNDGVLDTNKWDYEIGIKSGDDDNSDAPAYWGNNEKEYYIKEAVSFEDGKLVITANAITDDIKKQYGITDTTVKYTSARLRTVSENGSELKFATTYGRIEAKMELPHATGYWPAFWALPTADTVEKYGVWATSGEIDIMEAVGQNNNYVNGTIHYGSTWPNNISSGGSYYFPEGESFEGAHVYAIEWEPGEMRWYVDDVLYHVENDWYARAAGAAANYTYPAPFDEDFYLLLNLAVSGNYVSKAEPGEDELGKAMKVDYVRVSVDNNADYEAEVSAPTVTKDTEFFEANKVNADDSGNYLKDPKFETLKDHMMGAGTTVIPGLGYWTTATDAGNGASANIDVASRDGVKYAKIDVLKKGSNNYDIQLIQHVPLAKGYTYKLTFDAYTDVSGGRNFSVAPKGDADNGWAGYDSGIIANLTNEVKSFEHVFTMTKDSDPTARIEMNIGNALGTVYVGNAKLVVMSDEEVAEYEKEKLDGSKTPLDNGEHVYNGTFDLGENRFVYWNKEGDYTVDTTERTMKATINSSKDIDDTKLSQPGIQLLARDSYKLTLDASAAADGKAIKVGLYAEDGTVYGEDTYTIGTEGTEIVLEFTMPRKVTDMNAVLVISFGGNTVSVEIDNISLRKTTNMNDDWDASILYPLGSSETWSQYNYYVNNNVTVKDVPANGVVTEAAVPSTNNYDYMIYKDVNIKQGLTYELSFDIMASADDQQVTASVQQDETWTVLMEQAVTASTQWQTVTKQFKAETEGAINLKFLLSSSKNSAYNVSIRNVKLTVANGPYVTLTNAPEKMTVGTSLHLNAAHTASVNPKYEVYTYASSNTGVADISETGVIKAVAVGEARITVTSATGTKASFILTVVEDAVDRESAVTEDLSILIKEAEKYVKNADFYTAETYAEFKNSYDKAVKILKDIKDGVSYSQTAVDKAVQDLNNAIEDLEEKEGLWIKAIPDQTYTGKAIKPVVEVWDGTTKLTLKKDYTVSYKNNVKAGTATVTVTGKGNYKKSDTAEFKINKKNLKDADITAADVYANIKNGKVTNPKVTVKYGKKTLSAKTDYTVDYDSEKLDPKNPVADTYTITITAKEKSNYTGSKEIEYQVREKTLLMKNAAVKLSTKKVLYNGELTEKPAVTVTYTIGGKKVSLTEGTHYTVDYENSDVIGKNKAYVVVKAKDGTDYYGTKTVKYTVEGYTFNKDTITVTGLLNDGYPYTGEEVKPDELSTVTLVDKKHKDADGETNHVLTSDQYEISYSKNTNAGTATMILTGKGIYNGTIKKTFKINPVNLKSYTEEGSEVNFVCLGNAVYEKTGATANYILTFKNQPLVNKTDYTVSHSNNKKAGKTATVTIKGKGNFTGTISAKFTVVKPAADTVSEAIELTAGDVYITSKSKVSGVKSSVKLVEESTGKKLTAGTDYSTKFQYYVIDAETNEERKLEKTDLYADNLIHVRVTLKGNYEGTLEGSFRLYTKKASALKVEKIPSQVYTGKEICPSLNVYDGNTKLTENVDYKVTYTKNIKKGTATATITGIDNSYGGTKKVNFKITAAKMNWAKQAMQGIADFFSDLF